MGMYRKYLESNSADEHSYLVQLYGHRLVLLGSLVLLSCLIFITFFAPNLAVLCVGQVLCG